MRDRAVFTTAMSSMSIAVAAHTTASVQRWVCDMCGKAPGREEESGSPGTLSCGEPQICGANRRMHVREPGFRLVRLPRVLHSTRMDRAELERALVGGVERREIV